MGTTNPKQPTLTGAESEGVMQIDKAKVLEAAETAFGRNQLASIPQCMGLTAFAAIEAIIDQLNEQLKTIKTIQDEPRGK
jgi:hypothetical protein